MRPMGKPKKVARQVHFDLAQKLGVWSEIRERTNYGDSIRIALGKQKNDTLIKFGIKGERFVFGIDSQGVYCVDWPQKRYSPTPPADAIKLQATILEILKRRSIL